jgi:hypothetical protein
MGENWLFLGSFGSRFYTPVGRIQGRDELVRKEPQRTYTEPIDQSLEEQMQKFRQKTSLRICRQKLG